MKTIIEKYFTWIIIIILVIIILLEKSCTNTVKPIESNSIVTTKIDTVYSEKKDTIIKKIPIYISIPTETPNTPKYQPSDDIDTCKARFNKLLKDYITRRVYKDTIDAGRLGKIYIIDTVSTNILGKRTKILDLKTPTVFVTKTITTKEEPKRQLYIGGSLYGGVNKLQMITPGILYKTKKDNVYQVNIGVNFDGSITYGLGMYYKIQLHK